MFGLFKKKDMHQQALDLFHTYFKMPSIHPEYFADMGVLIRNSELKPEFTSAHLAADYVNLYLNEMYVENWDKLTAEEKRRARGLCNCLLGGVEGMVRGGVRFDSDKLSEYRDTAIALCVGELILKGFDKSMSNL